MPTQKINSPNSSVILATNPSQNISCTVLKVLQTLEARDACPTAGFIVERMPQAMQALIIKDLESGVPKSNCEHSGDNEIICPDCMGKQLEQKLQEIDRILEEARTRSTTRSI